MNLVSFIPYGTNFYGKSTSQPVKHKKLQDICDFSYKQSIAEDSCLNALLLSCGKNVKEIVENSLKNYINGGYTADFYNLSDKTGQETGYVLAITKEALSELKKGTYNWSSKFQNSEDMYPGFNFGQCVAEANGIRIHKKIEGVPSGVTYDTKNASPEDRYVIITNEIFTNRQNKQYDEHLKRLDKLSQNQKCFDDFAFEIMKMSERYMFDPFPNNVLVDVKKASLNIIDPTTKENSIQFQCHGNHLSGMLSSLFDPRYVKRQSIQARQNHSTPSETNPKHVAIRKKILKNCLIAAKKNNMSFEKNPYTKGSDNHEYCDLEYLFKIAGVAKEQMLKILELEKEENSTEFFNFVENRL